MLASILKQIAQAGLQEKGNVVWYFDASSLNGVQYTDSYPPSYLSPSQILPIVRDAITTALIAWAAPTDGAVQISEGTATNYNLLIHFVSMGCSGGEVCYGLAPWGNVEIEINTDQTWTDNTSLVPNYYPDIYTIILHEVGHVFNLTHNLGSSSVMNYISNQVKKSLTACDFSTVQNLYDPQHTITVQNSFGGGTVKVTNKYGVSNTYSSPYTFTVRESSWPWTISALDQSYP